MTDKERYKRTFSLLRASQEDFMEVKAMNDNVRILPVRKLAALCAAVVLVVAMATVAYAADVGGIRRAVQIWIHGDQTNAVLDIRGNSYNLSYEDEDGNPRSIGGVEYLEDGTVWVYYHDQKLEITDKFQDGVCYVQLKDGDKVLYLTVEEQGGYIISPHGYEKPTP